MLTPLSPPLQPPLSSAGSTTPDLSGDVFFTFKGFETHRLTVAAGVALPEKTRRQKSLGSVALSDDLVSVTLDPHVRKAVRKKPSHQCLRFARDVAGHFPHSPVPEAYLARAHLRTHVQTRAPRAHT